MRTAKTFGALRVSHQGISARVAVLEEAKAVVRERKPKGHAALIGLVDREIDLLQRCQLQDACDL